MKSLFRPARVAAVLAIASAAALALACKQGPPPPACPGTFKDFTADQQNSGSIDCTCPANSTSGSVWGIGIYTTDSNICAAATHAGAITSSGGTVTVKKSAGCQSYSGGAANGVTTSSWGPFDTSFYFFGKGTGSCSSAGGGSSASAAPPPRSSAAGSASGGAPPMKN
jgi:hypothetical protein